VPQCGQVIVDSRIIGSSHVSIAEHQQDDPDCQTG
jgi:hypothetical protein